MIQGYLKGCCRVKMVKEIFISVRDIFKDTFTALLDFFTGAFYDEKD